MRLSQAAAAFLESIEQKTSVESCYSYERSLDLLIASFTGECHLADITASRLREFLARWYVEHVSANDNRAKIPGPDKIIASLREFFHQSGVCSDSEVTRQRLEVIAELERTLPRALEIFTALSSNLAERGGAFGFSEFLTSFEEGGRSQYDIDSPGDLSAREGYFRLIQITGSEVEVEELITEDRLWPVIFPEEVARLLEPEYIINLEIIRTSRGWHIVSCGFAYPPGTEI
jgi:hypothetical protein